MLALSSRRRIHARTPRIAAAAVALALVACSSDTTSPFAPGFLGGTPTNHEVGVVVNSLGKSLTLQNTTDQKTYTLELVATH